MHTEIVPQQLKLVHAHGNSATATKLQAARNIKLQGAVSGNVNFDGTTNVTINTTQSNIAVLTGNISLQANTTDNASKGVCKFSETCMNYPSGFTKDNCVVIYYGRQNNQQSSTGWNNYIDSTDMLIGTLPLRVVLYGNDSSINSNYKNKIRIMAGNYATNATTCTYKIVLLKTS